ncbi:hypothetical protein EV183_005539 [Coemansia sp. RSA 2336]|nr:hypothetical protein EV183_005539 [Coemansia sp. RSA 2336]
METNRIAYIVVVVLAILIICVGAWYRRRRIAQARALQAAAEQEYTLQLNTWNSTPVQPQAAHVVYGPHSPQQHALKPEYLPPYQPSPSPVEPPPPAYPGPSIDSTHNR